MSVLLLRIRNWLRLVLLATAGNLVAAESSDVLVYGGTPAGIIAAVAAAREGVSVTVLEPTPWIGGMVAGGLSRSDIGKPETIGGVTREFFSRAAARYQGKFMWYAEPHANLETFREMLQEANVKVISRARLQSSAHYGTPNN